MTDAGTIFVTVGALGLILLFISLVAGEIFDGFFDVLAGDWFSGAVLGGFVSAFGFGAALASGAGLGGPLTIGVGVVSGVVVGGFAGWLTKAVRGSGTDATPRTDDVIGFDGTVVSGIPEDGFGVVTVRIGGHPVRYNARSPLPLDAGTRVHVTGVLSPTAIDVAPL